MLLIMLFPVSSKCKITKFLEDIKTDILKNLQLFVKDQAQETKAQTLKQEHS